MKFEATIYKTIELKAIVFASTYARARDVILDMGDIDFSHQDVVDYEISIEPIEELA